jgi:hypothetical protein
MWCGRRTEKIKWTNRDRNIISTIKRRKVNWTGRILRRICHIKHVIEDRRMDIYIYIYIYMTEVRGRRCKQLPDDLKERRGKWKLKEESLDRTLWRTRFGRGYGPVGRHTME